MILMKNSRIILKEKILLTTVIMVILKKPKIEIHFKHRLMKDKVLYNSYQILEIFLYLIKIHKY
jgi:hypothetical protein